ncbi:hypothetical protein BX616_002184 [Lobosporangium transversale]|nr:hypothetical protein BX616_002184 [Lobosporangium transversale]
METQNHQQTETKSEKPNVMIVGAGLGGLLLGILLERAGIPYHIYERATKLRALGSALTLGANILPVFEQLGLLPALEEISLPVPSLDIYKSDMKLFGSIKLMGRKGTGYENLLFERPRLYELLLKHVPSEKITQGKKVIRAEEKESDKVVIHCEDGSTFEGDILVGADGAYSKIRQDLFNRMGEEGTPVPKEDLEDMVLGDICMVGVAKPSHPEKYPQLKSNISHFMCVLGKDRKSWHAVSVPNNHICWSLIVQLTEAEVKEQKFRNTEWTPESNEAMIKDFYDLPSPMGGTMGELIDETPKDLISRVFLEEKIFKTWFHGRTVLLGDGTTWIERMVRHIMVKYTPEWLFMRTHTKNFAHRPQIAWLPLAETRGMLPALPQEGVRKLLHEN